MEPRDATCGSCIGIAGWFRASASRSVLGFIAVRIGVQRAFDSFGGWFTGFRGGGDAGLGGRARWNSGGRATGAELATADLGLGFGQAVMDRPGPAQR